MRKLSLLTLTLALLAGMPLSAQAYEYEQAEGDPLGVRIYTLGNGMRVYLSQNDDQPRVQTFIAVRAGGKNDPAESTGLAHYLEHLMFKGTDSFGTFDYEGERPLLDSIRAQYEAYGHTADSLARRQMYRRIDSLSLEASRYAIANEYDKLMAAIGSNGSNAFTDVDETVYTEDIPSNEVERWAKVQAERFRHMVVRGFHTELEAVYEEYNISLASDMEKVDKALCEALYPHHPYGQQRVIGKQEHLKNPSLDNVLKYYQTWYVPNNIAICMAGDIANPDSIVGIIEQCFGTWEPNEALPRLSFEGEEPLAAPAVSEVMGEESEMVALAWRLPAAKERTSDALTLTASLLSNGRCGLFDTDLIQSQQLLEAEVYAQPMSDYCTLFAFAMPKEGQTLEEARDLLLGEVAKLRGGDFDEGLLTAVVNNIKAERMRLAESNRARVGLMMKSFIHGTQWQDEVELVDRLSRMTKQDIVSFANAFLPANGYACVLKRQGEDTSVGKIDKPEISPIEVNRDKESPFVTALIADKPHDIEPVFVDFEHDLTASTFDNGNDFLYKANEQGGLFELTYTIDRGTKADPSLSIATQYIELLGTADKSAQQLQTELYGLACNVEFRPLTDRTEIAISGLAENAEPAIRLAEDWIANAQADEQVYLALVADILKAREDEKTEQSSCFQHLVAYGMYGEDNPLTHQLSAEELRGASPASMLNALRDLAGTHQTISYYGPMPCDEAKALIASIHRTSEHPLALPADADFPTRQTAESKVILAPYKAKNIYMTQFSDNGQAYDPALSPTIDLFNEYFGGGMNTVVFQELRESRGLAYSASAYYTEPRRAGLTNTFRLTIITQNDKMADCLSVFNDITESMPLSQGAFQLAKTAQLKRLATERVTRGKVLSYYIRCRDLGLASDPAERAYTQIQAMTLDDLSQFHLLNVKGRTYSTLILGDENDLDLPCLGTLGTLQRVTLEDIFGY